MSIFKRAFLYVTRKRGKTILLFAILLIMATFVLTGLSIWKASEAAQLDLRQSLGGEFDIFVDWNNSPYVVKENVSEDYDEETGITTNNFLMYSTVQFTPENIAAIKGVSGVKYCSARQDNLLPFDGLSLFTGTISTDAKYQGYTKALGVCNTEDDELFTTGTLTLADGRHISVSDTHVAIISQDLAEKNELKIGDYLTAHSYSVEDQGFTGPEIKVQIIGLFTPNLVEQFGETITTYDKIQNRVFVDLQTSKEIDGGEINYGFSALHVTIDDPQDMARVVADVKTLPGIDWNAFTVEVDNETYESAAAPLATLNELVVTLLVVIIVVSAIILALMWYSKKVTRKSVWWLFDRMIPAVAIVCFCIRFGNLMNSEIFGYPTTLPWGFEFVRSREWHQLYEGLPCHPTQIYEMLYCLVAGVTAWVMYHTYHLQKRVGLITGVSLLIFFGTRFALEFMKNPQVAEEADMTFNIGQWLSVPLILLGAYLIATSRTRKE